MAPQNLNTLTTPARNSLPTVPQTTPLQQATNDDDQDDDDDDDDDDGDNDNDDQTVPALHAKVDALKLQLHHLSLTDVPCPEAHALLSAATAAATAARAHCQRASDSLRAAARPTRRLKATWDELHRRRHTLLQLRAALHAVAKIHAVSQTLRRATDAGDHALMMRACVRFEALNAATAPRRMDDVYVCLHAVSGDVAVAMATSMRMLRGALREACLAFEPHRYVMCLRDFANLGAAQVFPDHVLQVFEEEAARAYEDAMRLDATPSQKVTTFLSNMRGLAQQFVCIIRFHAPDHAWEEETHDLRQLRQSMAPLFESRQSPLPHFSILAARIIDELKFPLLEEHTGRLLQVFQASSNFCNLTVPAAELPCGVEDAVVPFRQRRRRSTSSKGHLRAHTAEHSEAIALRRGGSDQKSAKGDDSPQSSGLSRRAWSRPFNEPMLKAVKSLAVDCLNALHAHHAEELSALTEVAESWARIRLVDADLSSMLAELISGIDGRLQSAVEEDERLHAARRFFAENQNAESATLIAPSLAVLRWASEYVAIAAAVPAVLSASLSNITDMFLSLLRSSIDASGRLQNTETESLTSFIGDLLLERPAQKSLADFMELQSRRKLRTFLDRYGSQRSFAEQQRRVKLPQESSSALDLLPYTRGSGQAMPSTLRVSPLQVARECVATDAIDTLSEILLAFSAFVEHKFRHAGTPSDPDVPQKLASLRSALSLGRCMCSAFYDLLAWDILGGWSAVAAVAETCRSFHAHTPAEQHTPASAPSPYVDEMLARVRSAYLLHLLPPQAAERLSVVMCAAVMDAVLEGFSRVRACSHVAAASQLLVDVRVLDMALVEHTGVHPCPGRERTESFVKATFLREEEVVEWVERHKRRFELTDGHVKALMIGLHEDEIPVVDQIITP